VGPHSCPVLPGPQALRERRSFTYSYYYSYARAGAVGPGSFYASECLGSEKLVYRKPSFREQPFSAARWIEESKPLALDVTF
jgi:hypothetical protein